MELSRLLLWVNCWLFVSFGVGYLLVPSLLSDLITGATPATASAMTDMRATYGGMALGLAFIFGLCAKNKKDVRLGVCGVLVTMTALAGSRLFGMLLDGSPTILISVLFGAEALMASLALLTLRKL